MRAATIDTLVKKGGFETEVALAIAEAMDQAIANAEVVTVPVLDARLAVFKSGVDLTFASFKADIDEKFAQVDARFIEVRADMDVRFAEAKADMQARFAGVDVKLARMETRLIFWILTITVGNNYLPQIVSAITRAIAAAWSS